METFSYAQFLTKEYKYIFLYYCMPVFFFPFPNKYLDKIHKQFGSQKISESRFK